MKIKSIYIEGLHSIKSKKMAFNDDINIITGRNGCGKTTILKSIWYTISGNIDQLLNEVLFKSIEICTNKYSILISKDKTLTVQIRPSGAGDTIKYEFPPDQFVLNGPSLDHLRKSLSDASESSIYFPTFRRIEGGYSLTGEKKTNFFSDKAANALSYGMWNSNIQNEFNNLSTRLSVGNHKFISSISTEDLVELINKQQSLMYSDMNLNYTRFAFETIKNIDTYQLNQQKKQNVCQTADDVIISIKSSINKLHDHYKEMDRPFDLFTSLAEQLLRDKSITFKGKLDIGKGDEKIESAELSSGEKQIVSFLCYNTFLRNGIIFIDEPEISLHVDWQRKLISLLEKQEANNQLIIATHSPFISAKYPEKEVLIDPERGE